jgi:18S rRNA (adenine1779-N6/adenine1780-N6)-dimethyltransferase
LFNRKNKTLRACLTTKSVVKLLEENRKTALSLQQQQQQQQQQQEKLPAGKQPGERRDHNDDDGDQIMQTPVQAVVEEILEREAWKGRRAAKLDLDDFLQLLAEFNAAGIHFR